MGWLQRLMYGRYGMDGLNMALMGLYLLLSLLSRLLRSSLLSFLAFLCLLFTVVRMFSRNIPKRQQENAQFMDAVGPALRNYNLILFSSFCKWLCHYITSALSFFALLIDFTVTL